MYQTSASRIIFALKRYFQSKTEKLSSTTELCIFKLVLVPNLSLHWQFWFSGPNLLQKGISSLNQKNEHQHWILQIQISLHTEFQFKLPILIFLNITNEFCIFELVPVTSFRLMILWTKSAQNAYSQSKTQKNVPHHRMFCTFKSKF